MSCAASIHRFAHLIRLIEPNSKLLRSWSLKGGVSAQVTALEIERADGQTRRVIVRQHGAVDLGRNPNIAADEFKLLQIVQAAGLAAPRPYALVAADAIFATPCLVVEYIDGASEHAPAQLAEHIDQIVAHLLAIHALDGTQPELAFLPRSAERYTTRISNRPTTLNAPFDEARVRQVLTGVWPLPQHNRSALLHGDVWPGNLLWRDGQLVAVIDWEDAARGDPLADLANARMELLLACGDHTMHEFTRRYQALAVLDLTHLPYWDLCVALNSIAKIDQWSDDFATQQAMRAGLRGFIDQALAWL